MRTLIIVESPAKARTLGNLLSKDYTVKASVGHIRDLPPHEMGVDVDNDFRPTYVIVEGKQDVVAGLKKAAKLANTVVLATDPDREGEAIAWHIQQVLRKELPDTVLRATFHEITESAIKQALANPGQLDIALVRAQEARRVVDRLMGYELSPFVSRALGQRGLSAGRVQSVALRLVVEREREITNFVPVEYWSIEAELVKITDEAGDNSFIAKLVAVGQGKPDLRNKEQALAIVEELQGARYSVLKVERKEKRKSPAPPFTTSTLQQEASKKLGFSPKQTMQVAQQLYEGIEIGSGKTEGLITYMRTDSVHIAPEAQAAAAEYIAKKFGTDYLPPESPTYETKAKGAQEAHEAIRPTLVAREPDRMKEHLTEEQSRLYDLIWKRFLASQMKAAVYDTIRVDIATAPPGGQQRLPYLFRATGSTIKFAGFKVLYEESPDDEEQEEDKEVKLPLLEEKEPLRLVQLLPKQHWTKPPPRFTEATLVKEMEKRGVGRPSTYAGILSTIVGRKYVEARTKKRQLHPTELGFNVCDLLTTHFPDIIAVPFTSDLEEQLDAIAQKRRRVSEVLTEFYKPFSSRLAEARQKFGIREPQETEHTCPLCGRGTLLIRQGANGDFMSCDRYPKCNYSQPVGDVPIELRDCPECEGKLLPRQGRKGPFWGCSNYPDCRYLEDYEPEE
jgi:DNA topoisomerase-1